MAMHVPLTLIALVLVFSLSSTASHSRLCLTLAGEAFRALVLPFGRLSTAVRQRILHLLRRSTLANRLDVQLDGARR